jgi:hypothetical protein
MDDPRLCWRLPASTQAVLQYRSYPRYWPLLTALHNAIFANGGIICPPPSVLHFTQISPAHILTMASTDTQLFGRMDQSIPDSCAELPVHHPCCRISSVHRQSAPFAATTAVRFTCCSSAAVLSSLCLVSGITPARCQRWCETRRTGCASGLGLHDAYPHPPRDAGANQRNPKLGSIDKENERIS